MSHVDALLKRYTELGFRLLYWERRGSNPDEWKGPSGEEAKGWNSPSKLYPLDRYDPAKHNLGTFTGHEIAPGKFLADVDFDWAEGLTVAGHFLPSTGFAFARRGKKVSHAFYTTSTRLGVQSFCDISDDKNGEGNGITFVELRGGDSSHETMIAPSLRAPDVPIELVLNGDLLHVDTELLQQAVTDYAIACLLVHRTPGGLHHDARLALAGYLLRLGLSQERIQKIGEEVCRAQVQRGVPDMSDKDIADMAFAVRTTYTKFTANKKFAGGPSLVTFFGPTYGKAIVARLAKYCGHADDFIRSDRGQIIARNHANIRKAIEKLGHELSYNQFAEQMLIDGKPFEDPHWKKLLVDIETEFRFQPPVDYLKIVIEDACWRNAFHPVKDYLDTLKWDGVPRLDTWLITSANAENSRYIRAISSIMLIAAVRRIRTPGAKYDEMVVWESPQGMNKSSAAQALCPNPRWFSDDLQLNLHSKELIEATLGKWIVECSELSGKRKTEIDQLKAMLSRQVDGPARMAYAHFPVQRPRHFILIGTTNSEVYLPDSTGSRRFWPMKVGRFDIAWILANRDQLWAEASHREAKGESIRLDEELWPDAGDHQDERREIDPWEIILRMACTAIVPSGDGLRRITCNDLWDALKIPIERRDRSGALRLGEIMQRLGFTRTRIRRGSDVEVGYKQVHIDRLILDTEDVDELPAVPAPDQPPF